MFDFVIYSYWIIYIVWNISVIEPSPKPCTFQDACKHYLFATCISNFVEGGDFNLCYEVNSFPINKGLEFEHLNWMHALGFTLDSLGNVYIYLSKFCVLNKIVSIYGGIMPFFKDWMANVLFSCQKPVTEQTKSDIPIGC